MRPLSRFRGRTNRDRPHSDQPDPARPHPVPPADRVSDLDINGTRHRVQHPDGETLLQVLRDRLDLPGTKLACGNGECGSCTVLVDGVPAMSCMLLAARVRGRVETIEGLAAESLPLREAFADFGAFQCGYCTPGQIVRACALLRDGALPADDTQLRHQLAGNICRCTGYAAIVEAIRAADQNRERK